MSSMVLAQPWFRWWTFIRLDLPLGDFLTAGPARVSQAVSDKRLWRRCFPE